MTTRAWIAGFSMFLAAAAAAHGQPADSGGGSRTLLRTGTTVMGEPIAYPAGSPLVTMMVITMRPGEATPWHTHPVPFAVYVLAGELTVAYEGHDSRTYRAGDAFVETMHIPHQGRATGPEGARLLGVFAGAEGIPTSAPASH